MAIELAITAVRSSQLAGKTLIICVLIEALNTRSVGANRKSTIFLQNNALQHCTGKVQSQNIYGSHLFV